MTGGEKNMLEKLTELITGKKEVKEPAQPKELSLFDIDYALEEKEISMQQTYNLRYWKPTKEGEQIAGKVLERGFTKSNYGSQEFIKIKDGRYVYMVFVTTVLARQLTQEDVQVGQQIGIRFLGVNVSQSNTGKKYRNYVLISAANVKKEELP